MPVQPIHLRPVEVEDLPLFFQFQNEAGADLMAAFSPREPGDRPAFEEHWKKLLADEAVTLRTMVREGVVVGYLGQFFREQKPEIMYWVGKEYWGMGVATAGLRKFLEVLSQRPLHASAAADNKGSLRVLEKCGFEFLGRKRDYARARGKEIEEVMMILRR